MFFINIIKYIIKNIFMKIAYISTDDPKDYISWSGLKLNIYKTLHNLNHNLKIVGPPETIIEFLS